MSDDLKAGLLAIIIIVLGALAWGNRIPSERNESLDFEVTEIEIDGQAYYLLDSGEIIKKAE